MLGSPTRRASPTTVPAVPAGSSDENDQYLALAALLLAGRNLGDGRPSDSIGDTDTDTDDDEAELVDDLADRRRLRFEEHALSRSRHPSARKQRTA